MLIKSLELENFRNYKQLKMEFDSGTNILYGDNAQGKTNILEALYLSGTTKSHKSSKDKEMIRFRKEESHIRTLIEKNDISYRIDMHLKRSKTKGIAINGIPIKKASELFGIVNFVFFSPEDLNILKNGPAERRRFLNLELCQLSRLYLHNLSNYNRVIKQRNALLKEISFRPDLKDTLQIWDEQLIHYGLEIMKERKQFILDLNEIVDSIHKNLSGDREELVIQYEPSIAEEQFAVQLEKNRENDIRTRMTSVGPHRDDLIFLVKEVDVRKYGSQGQQRTCALSLKLAEIELVKKVIRDTPVLLLDDVLSELDSRRQNFLLNNIHDIQTMISCTGLDEFIKNRFHINRIFRVVEGTIINEN
ncbi:MAG: DNA replication/repair protein RecF [Lachnospiraceae bacterium]|nr:DNA replication/repair protein RecF [Lachnospiraceae bacterium]